MSDLLPNVENVNLKSLFLLYKQCNSCNSICEAYDYIHFVWAIIMKKWAKEGQNTPRNGYNTNSSAQPVRKMWRLANSLPPAVLWVLG